MNVQLGIKSSVTKFVIIQIQNCDRFQGQKSTLSVTRVLINGKIELQKITYLQSYPIMIRISSTIRHATRQQILQKVEIP